MPNSLYPSDSLDQLPHFASPMKESAVISSVMVVLYPFLLHTVKPGVKRLWNCLYGIVADEKHAEQNRFGIRFVK